jgi:streptomycin 6-kinase
VSPQPRVDLPPEVHEQFVDLPPDGGHGPSGAAWLDRLPTLLAELMDRWDLRVDGAVRHGVTAVVVPTVRRDGSPAAVKVTWPHAEARHEHLALRAWDGHAAVRLLAADPSRWGLLLERLDPDHDLDREDDLVACRVVGSILGRLDRPALPRLDTLSSHLDLLVRDTDRATMTGRTSGRGGLPRRLLDQGRALAVDLLTEPGVDARLVHTDLHGQNVLRRPGTGEWVAIDPKPMSAMPEMAVAPVLWNRWYEVIGSDDPRERLNRRLETVCEHAGLDPDLARACSIVRMVRNALWALEAPGRDTEADVTVAVTVIKAMQPG